jgi:N-acetylmuramoyl-L-alanine amidase
MRLTLQLIFLCCLSLFSFSQSRNDSLRSHYQQKISKYLDKEKALDRYYSIDTSGISMFASPEDKTKNNIEYKIFWSEVPQTKLLFGSLGQEEFLELLKEKKDNDLFSSPIKTQEGWLSNTQATTNRTLKGMRIAIDPGHIANTMELAKTEKKFIDMKAGPATGLKKDVQLIEAELTFATALLLKEQLERAGAIVMITRTGNGQTTFGIPFEKWMQTLFKTAVDSAFANKDITAEEKQSFLNKPDEKDIFRKLFSNLETKERAKKINAFGPDLTVIIHYNVDEKNTDWKKPTNKNFDMAFVGGSFMKNELEKPFSRTEFLRLLLSDDIENSTKFSSFFIKSFEKNLNVPTAKESDADYLKQYCLPTGQPGVYSRNLTLTRMVRGTLVYGETLYQDNVNELQNLSKEEIVVNSNTMSTSKRVQQVANAYYEGILNYLSNSK